MNFLNEALQRKMSPIPGRISNVFPETISEQVPRGVCIETPVLILEGIIERFMKKFMKVMKKPFELTFLEEFLKEFLNHP